MTTLIRNCMVWDGTGAAPYPAEVLIEGDRIRQVHRGSGKRTADGAQVIDALGMTLMPGLVEGHAHLSFCGATKNTDLGDIPPEEHVIETLHNAKKLLDAGVSLQRIRKVMVRLREILPTIKRPLVELTLVATGDVVLVFYERTVFEAITGQEWLLDIGDVQRDVDRWQRRVGEIRRLRRRAAPGAPSPPDAAAHQG